jgi:hypothetical protein
MKDRFDARPFPDTLMARRHPGLKPHKAARILDY